MRWRVLDDDGSTHDMPPVIWGVYETPGGYIAKHWGLRGREFVVLATLSNPDLDELREWLRQLGLTRVEADPADPDPPGTVESWVSWDEPS